MLQQPSRDYRRELESHFPLIRGIVRSFTHRRLVGPEEAEELFSYVMLRFVESNYAPLRKFRGHSSFRTYLTTVIHRQLLDYRNHQWGKWRPSAAARRQGPVGVRLDQLLRRDRHTLTDAIAVLQSDPDVLETPEELAELALQLPDRRPLRFEGEELVQRLPSEVDTEESLLDRERRQLVRKVQAALVRAFGDQSAETRLIFRMRYLDGLKVRTIAKALALQPKTLYRRFDMSRRKLREVLETEGVNWEQVQEILHWPGSQLRIDGALPIQETVPLVPSRGSDGSHRSKLRAHV